MPIIRELLTRWGFDADQKELDNFEASFSNLLGVAAGAGAVFAASTAALAGMIVPAVQLRSDLAGVAALSGKAGDEFNNLTDDLFDLSNVMSTKFGKATSDVNPLIKQITAEARNAGDELRYFTDKSLTASKVLGIDALKAFHLADGYLDKMGGTTEDVTVMFDQLAVAARVGGNEISGIVDDIISAMPEMTASGNNFQQILETVSALNRAGLGGGKGMGALRIAIAKLSAPTTAANKALKSIGLTPDSFRDASGKMLPGIDILKKLNEALKGVSEADRDNALALIFGAKAAAALNLTMKRGLTDADSFTKALEKTDGALDSMFTTIMGADANAQLDRMGSGFTAIASTLGKSLSPAVTDVLKLFSDLLENTNEFLQKNPVLASTILGITAATVALSGTVAGVALITAGWVKYGAAVTAAGTATKAAAASTWAFLWPILAVGAAIAAAGVIINDFDDYLQGHDSVIGDLIEKYPKWEGEIYALTGTVTALGIAFAIATAPLTALIGLMATAVYLWVKNWDKMVYAVKDMWRIVSGIFSDITGGFDGIVAKGKGLLDFFRSIGIGSDSSLTIGGNISKTPGSFGQSFNSSNVSGNTVKVEVNVPPGSNPKDIADAIRSGSQFGWDQITRSAASTA